MSDNILNLFCCTSLQLARTRWVWTTHEYFKTVHTQSSALGLTNLSKVNKCHYLLLIIPKTHENANRGALGEKQDYPKLTIFKSLFSLSSSSKTWQVSMGVATHQGLPAILRRQRDVDPLLESTSKSFVDVPRKVGSRKNHDHLAGLVIGACHTVHLQGPRERSQIAGVSLKYFPKTRTLSSQIDQIFMTS